MTDIDFLRAQTARLEQKGIVLCNGSDEHLICAPCRSGHHDERINDAPLHPHPRPGRKRRFLTVAAKQKAYRYRRHGITSHTVTK